MHTKFGLLLAVACACFFLGCSDPNPSTPNTLPPCLMIDDILYYYTGEAVPTQIEEASILGSVTSTVPLTELPTKHEQSNMAPILNCPYAKYEESIVVLMEENWILFETRETD